MSVQYIFSMLLIAWKWLKDFKFHFGNISFSLFDIVIWGFLCMLVFFIIEKIKEEKEK